ncbi:hypothetical protein [Shewanella atlantica]|uniref:Tetratricopeptide repeat protein n=1 Tax=Shewanella atlantica TaxID=271099 RepID=A0A3S0IFW5_9GAMM|nr:hypothetical protein [Shewanella atlantica]RTR31647.1 hypothetical protein EKG39_13100 [Shewanella atlantica]
MKGMGLVKVGVLVLCVSSLVACGDDREDIAKEVAISLAYDTDYEGVGDLSSRCSTEFRMSDQYSNANEETQKRYDNEVIPKLKTLQNIAFSAYYDFTYTDNTSLAVDLATVPFPPTKKLYDIISYLNAAIQLFKDKDKDKDTGRYERAIRTYGLACPSAMDLYLKKLSPLPSPAPE